MRNFILVFLLLSFYSNADESENFPAGKWEGFTQQGHFNSAIIMYIDSDGNGFYGYSLGGKEAGATCFPINKNTLKKRVGYFEQTNKSKDTDMILLLGRKPMEGFEALSIFVYDNQKSSIVLSRWMLVHTEDDFINTRLKSSCERILKEKTED